MPQEPIPTFEEFQTARKHATAGKRPALTWGAQRKGHRHQGEDFGGSTDSVVGSADDGEVVFAGPNGNMGNTVAVRHPNGMVTRYSHLNRINVGTGAKVTRGQEVGLLGSTGNAKGPHVHFEVLQNDLPLDPAATPFRPLIQGRQSLPGRTVKNPTNLQIPDFEDFVASEVSAPVALRPITAPLETGGRIPPVSSQAEQSSLSSPFTVPAANTRLRRVSDPTAPEGPYAAPAPVEASFRAGDAYLMSPGNVPQRKRSNNTASTVNLDPKPDVSATFTPGKEYLAAPLEGEVQGQRARTVTAPRRRPAPSAEDLILRTATRNKEKLSSDLLWHFGPDALDVLTKASPGQKRGMVLLATQGAARDQQKKAQGQELKQSADYQNENRKALGLKPLVETVLGAAPGSPLAAVFKKPGDVNLSAQAQLRAGLGPLKTGPVPAVVTPEIENAIRTQARDEADTQAILADMETRGTIAERIVPKGNILGQVAQQWPAFVGRIQDLSSKTLRMMNVAASPGSYSGKLPAPEIGFLNDVSDYLARRAEINQSVAAYNPPKLNLPEKVAREIVRQGYNVAQIAATVEATGLSLPTVMVGEAIIQNSDKDLKTQTTEAAKAYAFGWALTKLPVMAQKGLGKVPGTVGRTVTRHPEAAARAIGAGTFGPLAAAGVAQEGGDAGDIAAAGIGGALVGGGLAGGGLKRIGEHVKGIPESAIRAEWLPEPVRTAAARAKGYEPVIVQTNEASPRFASVYYKSPKEQFVQEITPEQAADFTRAAKGEKARPFIEVQPQEFDRVAGFSNEGAKSATAPMSRQIEAETGKDRNIIPSESQLSESANKISTEATIAGPPKIGENVSGKEGVDAPAKAIVEGTTTARAGNRSGASGNVETRPGRDLPAETDSSGAGTSSLGTQQLGRIEPKQVVRHSDPNIDGGEVVGRAADGRLKVQNKEGGISLVQDPRRQGNREAAIIKESLDAQTPNPELTPAVDVMAAPAKAEVIDPPHLPVEPAQASRPSGAVSDTTPAASTPSVREGETVTLHRYERTGQEPQLSDNDTLGVLGYSNAEVARLSPTQRRYIVSTEREKTTDAGRWFATTPATEFAEGRNLVSVTIPKAEAEKYRKGQTGYLLPNEIASRAKPSPQVEAAQPKPTEKPIARSPASNEGAKPETQNSTGQTTSKSELESQSPIAPKITENIAEPGQPHPVTGRKFSSTQVDLPASEAALQKRAAMAIPDSELAADGREEAAHITVKYGLHADGADELRALLATEPAIKLTVGKVSIFPAKKGADYDVVKMDVDSPDLHRLNAKIAKALPVTDTHPEYKPHITLAYVKLGEGAKYVGQSNELTGKEITLDKILFSSKSGKEIELPLKTKEVPEHGQQQSTGLETTPTHVAGTSEAGEPPQRLKAPASGSPKGRPNFRPENQSLSEAVRAWGGIRYDRDMMNKGELGRLAPRESGTTGLVNNKSRYDAEDMALRMAEEGYRGDWVDISMGVHGPEYSIDGDKFLEAIENDQRGIAKSYSGELLIDFETEYRKHVDAQVAEEKAHAAAIKSADALVKLLEGGRGGDLFDKIIDNNATDAEQKEFRDLARRNFVRYVDVEDLIREAQAESVPAPAESQSPKSSRAEQLGFVQEGLEAQTVQPKEDTSTRDRLVSEEKFRQRKAVAEVLGDKTARLETLTDSSVALVRVAANTLWQQVKQDLVKNLAAASELIDALYTVDQINSQGQTVDDYLKQGGLFGESGIDKALVQKLAELKGDDAKAFVGSYLARDTPVSNTPRKKVGGSALGEPNTGDINASVETAGPRLRSRPIPASVAIPISSMGRVATLQAHRHYKAAKSGDVAAAKRLVDDLVRPEDIEKAIVKFPARAIFLAIHAEEASGVNAIPMALADRYAAATEGHMDTDIVQVNRTFHTGATAMERMITRPVFDGEVQEGAPYVLVDDVVTLGGTLAEAADYIQSRGGEVVGSVVLANASRTATLAPAKKVVRVLEERYGETIRQIFGVEPAALTASEAFYLIGFKDAGSLRSRASKAVEENARRKAARDAKAATRVSDDTPAKSNPSKDSKDALSDVGEKIGGARKDLATSTGPKATRALEPSDEPAWRKRFVVVEIVAGNDEGRWAVADTKKKDFLGHNRHLPKTFASEGEAEAAIPLAAVSLKHVVYQAQRANKDEPEKFAIYRKIGDRKVVQVVEQQFDSREDAMKHMATHPIEILDTKTSFGEEILPKPETVVRKGALRRKADAKPEDFMRDFGFRAVEFGNWNNQIERQEVVNHAYDALADMAELLNIPPKAVGLNGELAIAFGARGHGLTGARAHYEPNYGVMNLTKMSGAGALAHEWFHSLDHYFGRVSGKASREKTTNKRGDEVFKAAPTFGQDAVTHGFPYKSQARPEIKAAYDNLVETMFKKAEQYIEDAAKAEKFVGEARQDVRKHLAAIRDTSYNALSKTAEYGNKKAPATAEQLAEFDDVAQRMLNGEFLETQAFVSEKARRGTESVRWSNDGLERLSKIYKAVRGRSGFSKQGGTFVELGGMLRRYSARLKMLADAQSATEKTKKVPTSFAMEAKSIDQGRVGEYWLTPHEMAARAFQAYVEDKLSEQGGQNDFLSYGTHSVVPTPWGWKRPYPHGEEREAINAAFDNLFTVMQSRETEQGTVELFAGIPFLRSLFSPKPRNVTVNTPLTSDFKEVEERWKAAKGIQVPGGLQRATEALRTFFQAFRRHYIHLDPGKDAQTALTSDILRLHDAAPAWAKAVAYDHLVEITGQLDKRAMDVFTRNIVLPDILKDVEEGLYSLEDDPGNLREMPFGYTTKEQVEKDLAKFEALSEATPGIKEALTRRKQITSAVTQRLVDLGLLNPDVLKDDRYYHRQVLKYVNAQEFVSTGTGGGVRLTRKGFQKGRQGGGDFNTNYQEAEFEWLSQAYSLIGKQETLNQLDAVNNIVDSLKAQAKALNAEGGKEKTWEDLVPDTHTVWQPEKGNIFFMASTVEEKALSRILAGEKELEEKDIRSQLVQGPRKREWVIPKELAQTLEEMRVPLASDPVEGLWVLAQNSWKQWVLLNPARAVVYNFNNLSGDLDIALAYDPKVLTYTKTAAADLWRYMVKQKAEPALKAEIQDAIKRGVVDSGLTVIEIPDINKAGAFRTLVEDDSNLIARGVQSYWGGVKNFTSWRENILRLAAYRYFKQHPGYGASKPEEIDAIKDPDNKAAKLARELIGDYGNVSVAGQWIRRHLIPFYSWTEINAPRYAQLLRNTMRESDDGTGGGKKGGRFRFGAVTAKKIAMLYLKAHMLLGLISLWNHLMFPDEEKELRRDGRKPHIILGRASDGTIRTLKFQGAFADALEWFGLEDYPADIADLISKRKDWKDEAAEMVKAPAERIVNSLEPFSKSTFELATGRQLYPHFFREGKSFEMAARPIRDRKEYAARIFSLASLYNRITGKPARPLAKDPVWGTLETFLVYRTDPGEAAYWEIRGRLGEWQEAHGRLQQSSGDPTERQNALYYFKRASKWGDDKAATRWLQKYRDLGGTDKGLISSIRVAHPLGSLARKDWSEFAGTLSPEEKLMLRQSIDWYKNTYGDLPADDNNALQDAIDKVMEGERGGARKIGPRPPRAPGQNSKKFGAFEVSP